ncbi:ZIP family metal transporter [Frigoriflavimonas asaccharolytica]|uniref:Zinc transporter ZupT n=1 Tax=Frigoriflavimonas asaccharolytica TaxID=2735899 RepID=A0A8J8G4Z6_9FLAO|nr:ZIP family metal transporter [Frigoriflavimonas asaccharolytica]NRS91543.1 zinc transporter ZupT [Frigoriflavimonas asaccharolytica]
MIAILLISSVFIGIMLGKFFGQQKKLAKFILILSAGFLITVCLNEIFPEIYLSGKPHIAFFVIGGVLLQMLLEIFTKGFEHGHFHHPTEEGILPITLMFGLFIHAFIEGIPLADESTLFSPFLQGILIHNIPISFILGAFLFKNKKFNATSWIIIILFALASPLGMFLGKFINPEYQTYFLAIVAGIFLHISSVIIFESNKNHNIDWEKTGAVLLGIAAGFCLHFFHVH